MTKQLASGAINPSNCAVFYISQNYLIKMRKIKFYDSETDKTLIFLTNNFKLTVLEVAMLYKHRWLIETFFKWIKQHLKKKS
jgi:IS4 transposase